MCLLTSEVKNPKGKLEGHKRNPFQNRWVFRHDRKANSRKQACTHCTNQALPVTDGERFLIQGNKPYLRSCKTEHDISKLLHKRIHLLTVIQIKKHLWRFSSGSLFWWFGFCFCILLLGLRTQKSVNIMYLGKAQVMSMTNTLLPTCILATVSTLQLTVKIVKWQQKLSKSKWPKSFILHN